MLRVPVILFGFVVVLVGCVSGPVGDTAPVELGASAIRARRTSDAALSVIEIATAARLATLDTLNDEGTRVAFARFQLDATRTREAEETAALNVSKTEQSSNRATSIAANATRSAQTPTAAAIATGTADARARETQTIAAYLPTATRIAEIAEDAARTRAETIKRERDTEEFRKWVDMGGLVFWSVAPMFGAVLFALLVAYFVARILFAMEMFVRTAAAKRRVVYRGEKPVLYFLPDGKEYEILDPELLPQLPLAAPALPLPEENRTVDISRGGELVEKLPLNLVHGFDERDLMFLFRQIARGFSFSEQAMEKIELPYSRDVMGKQQDNTPYARFIDILVRGEIVQGRGGPGNKSGKLVITDVQEMMRIAKALPPREVG